MDLLLNTTKGIGPQTGCPTQKFGLLNRFISFGVMGREQVWVKAGPPLNETLVHLKFRVVRAFMGLGLGLGALKVFWYPPYDQRTFHGLSVLGLEPRTKTPPLLRPAPTPQATGDDRKFLRCPFVSGGDQCHRANVIKVLLIFLSWQTSGH